MTTSNILSQLGSPGVSTGFKNRIINGAMVIDQRNAGANVTITNTSGVTYTLDRFFAYGAQASKFSVQQNAGSVTPPTGFKNYLGATSLSAYTVGASEVFTFGQYIEGLNVYDLGWGTANAKTVTLSFQVYSSLTGTFGGVVQNSASNRSYPFGYSIPVANTWTTISVTIPGDTTGTWLTTNGIGITLIFSLGAGSTYSGTAGAWAGTNYQSATGATSVVGTNGATFYITGVQLEVGTTATNFEVRSYGTELALCQRYCWNFNMAQGGTGYARFGVGGNNGTTTTALVVQFPTQMRIAPSLTTPAAGQFALYTAGNTITVTSIALDQNCSFASEIQFNVASGLTGGWTSQVMSLNNATAYLLFSAEL